VLRFAFADRTHFSCSHAVLVPDRGLFPLRPPASGQNLTRAESTDRLAKIIEEASDRFAVPARWIRAVIQIESGGDEHAISPRGAKGLMQLMPGTWVELGVRYGLGVDPFDPRDNVFAGTAYLREMHDRFGSAGFLAAYHAGPSRYEHHLATGQPLPPDTVAYVAAVAPLLGDEHGERAAFGSRRAVPWRQSPLFIGRVNARD
jgi:soluble lytic murein transglycosylase-like protein